MWTYPKQVYNQENVTCTFQLEHGIAKYNKGEMCIKDYYSGFINLWTKTCKNEKKENEHCINENDEMDVQ